jgi:hypothetical protein
MQRVHHLMLPQQANGILLLQALHTPTWYAGHRLRPVAIRAIQVRHATALRAGHAT